MIPFHTELGIEKENRPEMHWALKMFCGFCFSARKKSNGSKTIQRKMAEKESNMKQVAKRPLIADVTL